MTPLRRLLTALLVLAAPAALAQTDLIVDGSFERGDTNPAWTVTTSSGATPLCTEAQCGLPPRTGGWFVFLGGLGIDNDMSVEQTVTIPANATTAVLTYYLQLGVGEDGTGLVAVFVDALQVAAYTDADAASFPDYVAQTVDLSAFADGQPHTIRFAGIEVDGTVDGAFFSALVDDVSLVITSSGGGGDDEINDDVFQAYPVHGSFQYVGQNNTGATAEGGEAVASCQAEDGSNSVWFWFTPSSDGTVTADLSGSSFDTILVLYALEPGGLVEKACDDDSGTGWTSKIADAAVVAGTPYLLRISGFQGAEGDYILNVDGPITGPPNDLIDNNLLVRSGPTYTDINIGATVTSGEAPASCPAIDGQNSVWRAFFAPATGEVTIDLSGSDYDTVLAVYDSGVTELACNDDLAPGTPASRIDNFSVVEGEAYLIRISGYNGSEGVSRLRVSDVLATAAEGEAPDALLTLRPVAPNPSSGTATVTASLAASAEARVEVFDVLGRSVTVLHDGPLATGETAWTWDAVGQPAGLYVIRMTAGAAVRTQTVTVVR